MGGMNGMEIITLYINSVRCPVSVKHQHDVKRLSEKNKQARKSSARNEERTNKYQCSENYLTPNG